MSEPDVSDALHRFVSIVRERALLEHGNRWAAGGLPTDQARANIDAWNPAVASLEQAIIRSHPDVIRLVEAARMAGEYVDCECVLNMPPAPDVLCKPHAALRTALAPFEEKD